MGTTTALSQLFMNLCHQTIWKYAILWKFQDENRMLLTCEDAYAIDIQSGIAMEYAPYKELISSHPRVTSFRCESNDQSGNIPSCSIEMTLSNMTRYAYLLGEGIVGKMASMEKHKWICVGEMNSKLLLECPEELQLQVAAGVKTILLMPVLPLGVVQLGSFDELSEDLTMVGQLYDLFCAYLCTSESHSTFETRMDQTYSYMALSRPLLEKCSTSLAVNTELTDPIHSLPPAKQDLPTVSFNQVMMNELLPSSSVLLPQIMVQECGPLTEDVLHQARGRGTDILDEISWNAMCNELFPDYSDKQVILNSSILTGQTMGSDQWTLSLHEREIEMIPVGLASENATMFDTCDLLQHYNDLCDLNKTHLDGEEFDVVSNSLFDSRYLDFSMAAELQNPVERSCVMSCNNSSWNANQSKADDGNEPIATFKLEVPKVIGYSIEEPCAFNGNNQKEFLALDVAAELRSVSDVRSCCSSSGRCSNSCLTQCKTDDLLGSEDSGLESCKMSSLISNFEGFTSYITASPSRSFHMQLKNEYQQDTGNRWRSLLKDAYSSHRQVKNRDAHRSRPRDRQLIQDRIRELRELIPNASKCSIDSLLERTAKHMIFLQNVPIHAEKLSQSTRPKVGEKDRNDQGNRVPQNESSWAYEMGTKSKTCPLIVENLDQPDQMLVETQCGDYGLFLEIGQAIKRLGLIILKGIFESRSEELWAHFIVEVPKGFRRMDILWPLMQLLRFKL